MKVKHLHIKLPEPLFNELKSIKDSLGINMGDFIAMSLREKFNELKKEENAIIRRKGGDGQTTVTRV